MRICPHCRAALDERDDRCPGCGADLRGARLRADDPLVGATLAGRYLVEECVGAGATGRVYRARAIASGAEVAVKVLFAEEAADEAVLRRFHQEARAMGRLRHPNNLAVLDVGETDGGHTFLVTELLHGRTLETVIRDEAPLDPARIVSLLGQALDALAEAHAAGVVHGDFKPSNVIVVRGEGGGERVKVIDYGVARLRGEGDPAQGAGAVCGTPDYMAPELIRSEAVDGRTDVYAAGVVLYEMLAGSRPFAGSTVDVLAQHLHQPPEPPQLRRLDRRIPAALERVCLRALRKPRGLRISSAAQMRSELAAALPALDRSAPPVDAQRWPLPLVGRDAALGRLAALRRRALLVVGPPGSGRSRLVEEWRRRLGAGERVVVMRADPSGARASWLPVRRALAAVLGLPERPSAEALDAALRDRPQDRIGLREVFGLAGPLPALERELRRREAHAAAVGLLREAAPALACEDVERYDRPSLEVVHALMLDAGLGRVVVTSTGRAELPGVETIDLALFGPPELAALGVDAAALELPDGAALAPLAVEEALRAAAEGAPDATAAGRLDALLPSARRVLAAAVVAGCEIDASILAHATAVTDVQAPLSSLAARGIARLEGGRVVLPSPTQRGAFYAALPDDERRALHRTLAGLLASSGADPAVVAHHAWAAAPEAAPVEALEAATLAAERAFDDPGAVRWGARALGRARAIAPVIGPAALVRIALVLGEALLRAGEPARAETVFKEALGAAGGGSAAALAHRGLARVAAGADHLQLAEAELLDAIASAGADAALAGEMHLELASVRDRLGRARDAETALIQGAVKAPSAPGVTWRLLLQLAEHNHAACRSEDARKIAQQALAAAAGGPPLGQARVHALLAVVEQALGDSAAATAHRHAALAALRAIGDRRSTAELLLGCALVEPPDEVTPRRWLAEAGELARQVGWLEGMARAQEALRMLA